MKFYVPTVAHGFLFLGGDLLIIFLVAVVVVIVIITILINFNLERKGVKMLQGLKKLSCRQIGDQVVFSKVCSVTKRRS